MATQIYLGNPPPKIKEWIEKNVETVQNYSTVKYADGSTVNYEWSGVLDYKMVESLPNKANIIEITLGTDITSIRGDTFCCMDYNSCYSVICLRNDIKLYNYSFASTDYGSGMISYGHLEKITISNTAQLTGICFYAVYPNVSFPNQTCETVAKWFDDGYFGDNAPCGAYTITCSNGVIHANSVEEETDDGDVIEKFVYTITYN